MAEIMMNNLTLKRQKINDYLQCWQIKKKNLWLCRDEVGDETSEQKYRATMHGSTKI